MLCIAKKTLEVIKKTGNDAIIQIKENQSMIYSEATGIAKEQECISTHCQKPEKSHGRIVSRQVRVFAVDKVLKNTCSEWKEVEYIVEIKRTRQKFNTIEKSYEEQSIEYSYYVSTLLLDAKEFLKLIQNHWRIENRNHCVKDVTFKEDYSRIRINPMNFSILRSFSLNTLRANNVENIADARDRNKMNIKYVLSYKGIV